jgi:predicted NBD/HSP70 family sugar kinase
VLRIGIDLGGTKTSLVVLDQGEEPRFSARRRTPAGSYSETLAMIGEMIREAEDAAGPANSIGIGTPGSLGLTGKIRNANSTCLNGMLLKTDLETLLGRSVVVANDANCFALSEATDGAARGAEIVFGVILGTGVGAGIVIEGRLVEGANHIAGEWGHNPLPNPDPSDQPLPKCYCGRRGCIESFLSGPGLAADFARATGLERDATEIVLLAGAGSAHDPRAALALSRYAERLARALAGVINILDPHVIVLGGGLSQIDSLYEAVPRLWGEHIFSDSIRTALRRNLHGDDSGVRGAAWLGAAPRPTADAAHVPAG